jgi:heme/copper-type cytochrome/quinol oxidase subunit 4
MMGFTMILMLVYFVLLIIDVFAFIRGIKEKKWLLFISITLIMIIGILVLGYLWITSSI